MVSQIDEAVGCGDNQTAAALRDQRVGLATEARQAADDAAAMLKALSTVGALVYNLCADLVGGIELTLSER